MIGDLDGIRRNVNIYEDEKIPTFVYRNNRSDWSFFTLESALNTRAPYWDIDSA
jgi:hypothetical protein